MNPPIQRAVVIVLDGLGCGALPDAADYGDAGTHTLAHTIERTGLRLPNLERWGLGNLLAMSGGPHAEGAAANTRGRGPALGRDEPRRGAPERVLPTPRLGEPLAGAPGLLPDEPPGREQERVSPALRPEAAFGRMAERSRGKDTTTGHWEIAGLVTHDPFTVFPQGFPPDLIAAFERAVGVGVLGNRPASGTAIIEELGAEHLRTGRLIVYTSADSVFQIAAHADVLPVADLYVACEKARALCDPYRVGRIIARPFVGAPGDFRRTYDRRDFPMPPPAPTLLEGLRDAGFPVVGVGKIDDIFAGRGLSRAVHTEGNTDGLARIAEEMDRLDRGLLFANLVDTDMLYGHRRDAAGFASALAEFDTSLPALERRLRPGDLLFITADHGCDPTHSGTDHTREHVPLLVRGGRAADLGTRTSFADLGQTIARGAGLRPLPAGTSFLEEL